MTNRKGNSPQWGTDTNKNLCILSKTKTNKFSLVILQIFSLFSPINFNTCEQKTPDGGSKIEEVMMK